MLTDSGDSGNGDPELCGLQAYCFDCRHVGPAADFKVIGGGLGARQCPKCGSLRVAIEGTSEPDLTTWEVSVSAAVITDDQRRDLVDLLKSLGMKVGKGKLADVRRDGQRVIVIIPRAFMLAVFSALSEVGVSEDDICCRSR